MSKLSQPAVRRATYFVVAAVLAVLVAVGLVSEEQYASWTELAERFLPLLGTIALTVAGAKTHEGSDDKTTREDLQLAYQAAQPTYVPVQEQFDQVLDTARQSAGNASKAVDDALESARAAYRDATRRG